MDSKTPQFDSLLDEILDNLVPHNRVCKYKNLHKYCEGDFEITEKDIEFLKILRSPAPVYCPTCRRMNRLSFVNLFNLYKRDNNASKENNKIISFVPPSSKLIVYDLESYKKDFDPYSYGVFYDDTKSFFEQFWDLRLRVPQPALIQDPSNINSDYSINGRNLKNGYYVSGGWNSENVWYSVLVTDSRNVMDSYNVHFIENSYEIVLSEKCYNSKYIYLSDNCINSSFMYECSNCTDCFGCVNLRNKSFCIFNVKYTKEEYLKYLSKINLEKRSSVKEVRNIFWEFVKSEPKRAERHKNVHNVSGANISNSRNCFDVFDCVNTENVIHCDQIVGHKDSMDVTVSGGSERLYQTVAVGSRSSNTKFSFASKFITESEFVINCRNIHNCFACIGLQDKSYCILNRQYEKEDYFKELDRIKTLLLKNNEYSDFFPYKFSSFAYNGSIADITYPLNKDEVLKIGGLWQEETQSNAVNLEMIQSIDIPDIISSTNEDILSKALICRETGRPFRITNTEFEFYKDHNIPLPDIHPNKRIKDRYYFLGNLKVKDCKCYLCGKEIKTVYNNKDGWKLYCDECYKREIM